MSTKTEKAFIDAIRPRLADLGFRYIRQDDLFEYNTDGLARACIRVGLVPTSERGVFKIAISLHIRLGPEEILLAEAGDESEFLLNINFDNVWTNPETGSRLKTTSAHPEAGATFAAGLIGDEIVPFVKQNSREMILANLRQENPRSRITSDVNARFRLLLANAVIAGDKDGFDALGTDFVAHCRRFLPHLAASAERVVEALRDRHRTELE